MSEIKRFLSLIFSYRFLNLYYKYSYIKIHSIFSILLLAILVSSVQAISVNAINKYQKFRSHYKLHMQTIALSNINKKSIVLLISEPPPYVELKLLKEKFPIIFKNVETKKIEIGVNGYVTDLVTEFKRDRFSDDELASRIKELGIYLFGSSYRLPIVFFDDLNKYSNTKYNLDISITSFEINTWLFSNNLPLYILDGNIEITADHIFKKSPPSSFVATSFNSNERISNLIGLKKRFGLVVWWIPKCYSLEEWKTEARQFAIESDLILGAVVDESKGALIIGRSRIVPIEIYSPVRFETLSMLSKVKEKELAQSYQRSHPIVSKLPDDSDWAPIYLSPILKDTEYGSLLNITDQILKNWSNNGMVNYKNFNYQTPAEWPFKKPLAYIVTKEMNFKSLTFNWNTRGHGFVSKFSDKKIYTVCRTGSLPTSYYPENTKGDEKILEYEDIAHNYFATQYDTNLAKVAQYLSYYQIFKQFFIFSNYPLSNEINEDEKLLSEFILRYLQKAKSDTTEDRRSVIENYYNLYFSDFQLKEIFIELYIKQFNEFLSVLSNELIQLFSDDLAKNNPSFSSLFPPVIEIVKIYAIADNFQSKYSIASKEKSTAWIHTPSIVFSKTSGEIEEGSGGHNLSSKISDIEIIIDDKLPKEKIKVSEVDKNGNCKIIVSSKNPYIPNKLIRSIVRNPNEDNVNSAISNIDAPRTMELALGGGDGANVPPTNHISHNFFGKEPGNWWNKYKSKIIALIGKNNSEDSNTTNFYIARSENGMIAIFKEGSSNREFVEPLTVGNIAEASDNLSSAIKAEFIANNYFKLQSNKNIRLIFVDGFTIEEANGLKLSALLALNNNIKDMDNNIFARWYSKEANIEKINKIFNNKLLNGNNIEIGNPSEIIQTNDGILETSFDIYINSNMTINTKAESRQGLLKTKFSKIINSTVIKLKKLSSKYTKKNHVREVLDDIDIILRNVEKKGDVKFLKELKVEAMKMQLIKRIKLHNNKENS